MRIFTLLIAFFITAGAFAQSRTVSGSVVDTAGAPLASVTVNLKSAAENLSVKTNTSGKFQFSSVSSTDFIITITGIGFADFVQSYTVRTNRLRHFL